MNMTCAWARHLQCHWWRQGILQLKTRQGIHAAQEVFAQVLIHLCQNELILTLIGSQALCLVVHFIVPILLWHMLGLLCL